MNKFKTTSQLIMDTEQTNVDNGNREAIQFLKNGNERLKTNNKNIEINDFVETKVFGKGVVIGITKEMFGDLLELELENGETKTIMNTSKFVWKI